MLRGRLARGWLKWRLFAAALDEKGCALRRAGGGVVARLFSNRAVRGRARAFRAWAAVARVSAAREAVCARALARLKSGHTARAFWRWHEAAFALRAIAAREAQRHEQARARARAIIARLAAASDADAAARVRAALCSWHATAMAVASVRDGEALVRRTLARPRRRQRPRRAAR